MKRLLSSLLCGLFLIQMLCIGSFGQSVQAAQVVKIAFVLDGKSPANEYFLKNFKTTIRQKMDKGTAVEFPANLVFVGDWTEKGVKQQCDRALNSNATTVVALGYLSSKYYNKIRPTKKMVVTIDQYGLKDFGTGMFTPDEQFAQNLELFNRLLVTSRPTSEHYKPKMAVLMNDSYYVTRKDWNSYIKSKLKDKSIDLRVIPVGTDVTASMNRIPADVDAALVLPQFKLSMQQLEILFASLSARGIKTFSVLGESDVKAGCMMGSGALDMDRKISEATSFNIKNVLDGRSAKMSNVLFMEDSILYVNIDTCDKVGYQPPLRLLNAAKVITNKKPTYYSLSDIFNRLDEQNMDIEQKSYLVKAAQKAALSAKLKYLPHVNINLGYQLYDHNYAESAALLIPQSTGIFGVGVDQVIYSPELVTNILIKSKKVKFEKETYRMTQQNLGIDIATMYIDTLMLKNELAVQEEYVQEARENLGIARVREKMGYCGKEEVMRWASQLSISEQRLLDMNADYKNVKIKISKLLNELDTDYPDAKTKNKNKNNNIQNPKSLYETRGYDFELKPLKANDPAFYTSELNILDYVRTPQALEDFTRMLVDYSYEVAPELAKLRLAQKMKRNERSMYIQKFVLPSAKFSYEYQNLMGRTYGADSAGPLPGTAHHGAYSPTNPAIGYSLTNLPLYAMHSNPQYHKIGVYAQWKILEGGSKFAEIARVNAELKQLEAQEVGIKLSLQEHVRTVINQALAAYFSIEKDYKATFTAKDNYERVKADYLVNKTSITQLLDAERTYFESKLKAANSQNEFFKQLVWVQRAICAVNWTKADPAAHAWIQKVKTDLQAMPDVTL